MALNRMSGLLNQVSSLIEGMASKSVKRYNKSKPSSKLNKKIMMALIGPILYNHISKNHYFITKENLISDII
jgi:hypothetical protein